MRTPPAYQLKQGATTFGAVGVFCLGLGFVRWERQDFVAAAACLFLSASFWAAHVWWQRRYEEWHPGGVDLLALRDNPPEHDVDMAELHEAARWTLSSAQTDEANSLLGKLKDGIERPLDAAPEMEEAWIEMVEIESITAGNLTALLLGGRQEEWWSDEIFARLQCSNSWTAYWPHRAQIVDSATALLESAADASRADLRGYLN